MKYSVESMKLIALSEKIIAVTLYVVYTFRFRINGLLMDSSAIGIRIAGYLNSNSKP